MFHWNFAGRRPAIVVAAAGVVTLLTAGAASAASQHAAPATAQTMITSAAGHTPGQTVKCAWQWHDPFYAAGSGVIFRVTVVCDGNASVVFHGVLGDGPRIGPPVPRASTTQDPILSAGQQATFYTPDLGHPGLTCKKGLYYTGWGTDHQVGGTTASFTTTEVTAHCP